MAEAKNTRPIGVYFLEILIVVIAGWNGLRLGETFLFWNTLKTYAAFPLYIAISGGVWLVLGLFLAWSLWHGKAWGRMLVLLVAVVYIFWYWFDRLILQEQHSNWPFVLISHIIFLIFIFSILVSKKVKRFFLRDANERKPETPTIA